MSGLETDIQWFLARDGKQYGPISDIELRKFVELGHLKPADLVWRQGFADWRTAVSVFPAIDTAAPAAAAPATPSSATQEAAAPAAPAPTSPAVTGLQPITTGGAPQAASQPAGTAPDPARLSAAGPAPQTQPRALVPNAPSAQSEARPSPGTARPEPAPATRPLGGPAVRTAGPHPAAGAAPGFKPSDIAPPPRAQPAARAAGRKKVLLAAGLLAMTGVGAWIASQYKDDILAGIASTPGEPSETGTATANLAPSPPTPSTREAAPAAASTPPETAATPEPAPPTPTPDDIDRKLQNRTMWVAVKQQFPDWYQARLVEVTQLETAHKSQDEINRHLIDELVSLRRQNAQHALAASSARHKELASAFLANLKQLAQESGDGCYDFISKGESSAAIVSRLNDPTKSAEIEAQVVVIVTAIVEGRNQPATHASPIRTDYDVLAGELGRLGWTQADMQLFADPKALAQAPRTRVCSMLQDWFTAHLAIQDPATQARLLFETLKPVISG